ncbi:DUF397 domain-containing protein [Streptomyces decoyicus]|uniref:DUF397 domain-containing protein n=1 Tax=Streptomyces decoyicus TaxID=249567 RepID=UPI003635F3F7
MSETPNWRKSSYSGGGGNDCIEVADNQPQVMVRDTKQAGTGPILKFESPEWSAFVDFTKGFTA